MKKFLLLIAAFALTLSLAACGGEEEIALPTEDLAAINDVDQYLGSDDAQFVDLRNFDDKMNVGYIAGFEFIPFFDYLQGEGILVKSASTWTFTDGDIKDADALKNLFDQEKTIILMCGSGARAGYVKAALESIGYTKVINAGGISTYSGDYKVLGDNSFQLNPLTKGDYTPGVYFGESEGYLAVITINAAGGIESIALDAISCTEIKVDGASQDPKEYSSCTTKQTLGDDYNMVTYGGAQAEWYVQANSVAAAVLANQGWNTNWDGDTPVDTIAGVSIHIEGFKASIEAALTAAMPAS